MLPYLAVCLETDPKLIIVCRLNPVTVSELMHHFTLMPPFSEMQVMQESCSHFGEHETYSTLTFFPSVQDLQASRAVMFKSGGGDAVEDVFNGGSCRAPPGVPSSALSNKQHHGATRKCAPALPMPRS